MLNTSGHNQALGVYEQQIQINQSNYIAAYVSNGELVVLNINSFNQSTMFTMYMTYNLPDYFNVTNQVYVNPYWVIV